MSHHQGHHQPDELARLTDRVTELEMLYMHLQRTVQELNEVVIQYEKRLDTLESGMGRLLEMVAQRPIAGREQDEDDTPTAG